MTINKILGSPEETIHFAKGFASDLENKKYSAKVILLWGDIGAGKTTFVKGFMSFWGLEKLVSSPTFTILNEYKNRKIKICHYDFYRLNSMEEVEDIGIEDFIIQSNYSLIEWPDKAMQLFNFSYIRINFFMGNNEQERRLEILTD